MSAITRKLYAIFSAALLLGVVLSSSAAAQSGDEAEAASESQLLRVMLPGGALRVLPSSVPAEITQTLDKITAAGNGKIRQGDSEVLVWTGANYRKANAPAIVDQLTDSLKNAGWRYAVEGEEGGVTAFTAFREGNPRRAVVGFYGATDEALILAAMEILPNNGAAANREDEAARVPVENAGGDSIVGAWSNGAMSLVGYQPRVGGTFTPGKSHIWRYTFHADGTFEFVGLLNSTVYNCTTSLFQDKRGRYEIRGNQITLTLSKNFWRKQNSCAPSSNSERDYKLDPETYSFRTGRNSSGRPEICLDNGGGETCYERRE